MCMYTVRLYVDYVHPTVGQYTCIIMSTYTNLYMYMYMYMYATIYVQRICVLYDRPNMYYVVYTYIHIRIDRVWGSLENVEPRSLCV